MSLQGPGEEILMLYLINQRVHQFNLFSNYGGWSPGMQEGLRQRNQSMEERYLF